MIPLYLIQMSKNKFRFLVPFVVLFALVPALIEWIMASGNTGYQMSDMLRQFHVWIPLFATWWILLYNNDFFSSDGNELMYLIYKPGQIVLCQLFNLVLYLLFASLAFVIIRFIYPFSNLLLCQLLVEAAMMGSMAFFCCYLFQNTGAALLVAVFYDIYLNLFDELSFFQGISIFPQQMLAVEWEWSQMVKAVLGMLVFFVTGAVLVKKRRVYK